MFPTARAAFSFPDRLATSLYVIISPLLIPETILITLELKKFFFTFLFFLLRRKNFQDQLFSQPVNGVERQIYPDDFSYCRLEKFFRRKFIRHFFYLEIDNFEPAYIINNVFLFHDYFPLPSFGNFFQIQIGVKSDRPFHHFQKTDI